MNSWLERAKRNLIARSRSNQFEKAKEEWRMTGAMIDNEVPSETCELCEHPEIRYEFEILNRLTSGSLWVGSECIKKFVPLFEGGIELTDQEDKAAYLNRVSSELKQEARQARAFLLLDALRKHEDLFEQDKWRDDWKLGYSVRQLKMIAAICRKHSLPFNASDFRINTRRGRVVDQLTELNDWQYRQLRTALTAVRRREFDTIYGLPNRRST